MHLKPSLGLQVTPYHYVLSQLLTPNVLLSRINIRNNTNSLVGIELLPRLTN